MRSTTALPPIGFWQFRRRSKCQFLSHFGYIHFFLCSLQAAEIPDWISFAGGVFNITKEKYRTLEIDLEYKFHVKAFTAPFEFLEFLPLVGLMANADGGGYVYGGLNFDFLFGNHFVFAPGFAAGVYWQGGSKDLGYPLEFRSGIECGWQCDDGRRFGLHFYHLSNASLGKKNPGEESFVLYYDLPIRTKFPFYN